MTPVVERATDSVFVEVRTEGTIELRIGMPIKTRFETTKGSHWAVPSLMDRAASLYARMTPDEARVLAHTLLAAAHSVEGVKK